MTVPEKIYNFIIEPIRSADQRDGHQFLERWLQGPQEIWERIDASLHLIPSIWSVEDCPDRLLKYLKWIVGWTTELDFITSELTDDELRRLISISGRLWKWRGSEDTIVDVMRFSTGARNRYWNYIDFRWIIGETGSGEEHDGRDPWIIGAGDEYESNLRIVDDGTLNRALVRNLLKLMRATGERWEITYLAFLDQFIIDGDDTQWVKNLTDNPSLVVADGKLTLADTSQFESTWVNSTAVSWATYMVFSRLRGTSHPSSLYGYGFVFYRTDASNYYMVRATPQQNRLDLYRVVAGTPALIGNVAIPAFYDNVWYGYRVVATVEDTTKLRIKVYVDANERIDYLDASPLAAGAVGVFHDTGQTVEADEVEVMDLPGESDYVDINS